MSAPVSVNVLADGVPIDCGGMADSLAGCYGAVPAVGIAAVAVLGGATLVGYTAFSVFFPQVLNALLGIAGGDSSTPPVLHSRSGAVSNREAIDGDLGLPRTQETIERYVELAGVDLRGAPVEIIESPDDVAYLDFMGAIARTDADGVQLGPAAFIDEETLVRTLGHESIHVEQYRQGRITSNVRPLEDEAYAAEDGFVETWRRNTQ